MKHQKYFPDVTIFWRIALVLSLIGMPSFGRGQEQALVQPKMQFDAPYPLLLSSSWLRVGPSAQNLDLYQFLAVSAAQVDQTIQIAEVLAAASTLELAEQETGVNSQVSYVIWLMLRKQSNMPMSATDLLKIGTTLDAYELEAAWGKGVEFVQASDGITVTLPLQINPATVAVLSTLISHTPSDLAINKLNSLAWYYEFQSLFLQYFGDPLKTPDRISAGVTDNFRLPFAGNNRFNGGLHGGGNINPCNFIWV